MEGITMLKSNAQSFAELRQYLDNIPIIETHEHYTKYQESGDALDFIFSDFYFMSDYVSAGGEWSVPKDLPLEERFEMFSNIYKRTDKTAYSRAMQEGLRQCWGVDDIGCFEQFKAFDEMIKRRTPAVYDEFMEKLKIKAKVVDMWNFAQYADGNITDYSPYCRFAFSLPSIHDLHKKDDILKLQKWRKEPIITLDDYLECFDIFLQKSVDFGIVCFKDQSAYMRPLNYGNPAKAEAERVFNEMIFNPRTTFSDADTLALDDFIFQYAMRKAAFYDLPVQLHTGHLAGIRNDIRNANAAQLIPTIELHTDVRFDLFHGNWPHMDEYLFMGKNYPNVYLNLCWVQSIDPLYCVELMKRAVMTVPHSKVFAFGGDTGMIEWVAGYLTQAKDNTAIALSELVESGWLNLSEAKATAADWFFNNPNSFYKLGFEKI
jgi:hypothetical protein